MGYDIRYFEKIAKRVGFFLHRLTVGVSCDRLLSPCSFLRSRVETADFEGSIMSMSEFRTALLEERGVELYMEGHRFFDLTRMGVYDEYCRTLHGDIDGARQAEDYLWPIPISETSANNNID